MGSKKSVIIFYIIEVVVTVALFLWLYNLTTSTGNIKFNIHTGSVEEVATFVALGTLAWVLGLTHGLDADHLAAIDNTTRKLMQEKKSSTFTGTFFSLGHSISVFVLALGLILAAKYLTSFVPAVSIIGALVSAVFLYIIAILNTQIVFHIWGVFKKMEAKKCSDAEVDNMLASKGFMNKYIAKLLKIVDQQWYMLPIGFLFGLSFDTATQVALLAISVTIGSLVLNVPFYALFIFPLLFAAGLIITDSTDGFFMNFAYGWAFRGTLKKLWYNITMTTVSILVALLAASIETFGLVSSQLNLGGPFWGWINAVSGQYWSYVGIGIIITFVSTFTISFVVYKARIKTKIDAIPC
ncbi:MAG: HoxN/HupN/NixA family nickel/cobalt transporter [Candidatus Bathyarchaeia archaeon]